MVMGPLEAGDAFCAVQPVRTTIKIPKAIRAVVTKNPRFILTSLE
jgi:hypothetical protein